MKCFPANPPARARSGFTLVELLVVVTIIVGLMAVAASLMQGNNPADATRTAASELRSMVELAQSKALTNGNYAALLICKKYDPADTSERCLRFALVVERQPKSGGGAEWIPSGNGSFLTKGAYYWPDWRDAYNRVFSLDGDLVLGAAFTGIAKSDWIALVFSPQGIPVEPSGTINDETKTGPDALPVNPRMLVTSGLPGTSGLEVTDKEKLLAEGFMVQRSNGRVVIIESPSDQLEF